MTDRPSPSALYEQARIAYPENDEQRDRAYRELLREHGHLVPGTPQPLPCGGWPGPSTTTSPGWQARLLAEASQAFLYDSQLHAQAYIVAGVLANDVRERTGARMSEADVSLARLAAMVAFKLADAPAPAHDPAWPLIAEQTERFPEPPPAIGEAVRHLLANAPKCPVHGLRCEPAPTMDVAGEVGEDQASGSYTVRIPWRCPHPEHQEASGGY